MHAATITGVTGARIWGASVLGAATATLATLAAPAAFAEAPPPIVTSYVPEQPCTPNLFAPLTNRTAVGVVPQAIIDESLCRGATMAPHLFRTQGIPDDHNLFAPLQHPGRLMDRTVEALHAVGIEVERPVSDIYDWMKPLTAATLLLLLSLVIMKDYSKRPLIGGRTPLGESLAGAGILLSLVCALHSLPYALSGAPRFNYAAATANYLVMGMWAFLGAWSLVASLSFRLPGPVFKRLFMRKRTQHAPFILTGPKLQTFVPASADAVREVFRAGNGTFAFQVEAAHLERDGVRTALHRLGKTPVTATLPGLPREEFLTMRPMLDTMHAAGYPFTVKATSLRNLKHEVVPNHDPAGFKTVLVVGSRLPDRDLAARLVAEDLAYWQDGHPDGRIAITKKDIPVADLQTPIHVLGGALREERTLDWPPKKLGKNGSYTVVFEGTADDLLPVLADGIARRPILNDWSAKALLLRGAVNNLIPTAARPSLHRHIWPTTVHVAVKQAPTDDAAFEALAVVAGQERYAVRPQSPLVPVSRAVAESIGGDTLTLAMKAKEWARHERFFRDEMGVVDVETFPDNAKLVAFHLPNAAVVAALTRENDTFAALARKQGVRIAIPVPLLAPKDVALLTPHEDIAICVPPGDATSLDDLRFPTVRPHLSAERFLRGFGTVGRSTRQGVTNGRVAAISALTTAGVPIAAPVTITTKMLTGYTDAATWMVSGLRLFISGGINTIFLPVMRSWFGAHRLNNYLYYLPGLFVLALVYETANDVMHDEPERMWYKMLAEDLSYEGRPEGRASELAALHAQEPRVGDRKFALNFRLGNLLPTGYYTAEDAGLLMEMYAELGGDTDAEARFLAGLIHDPGFVYLVQQDEKASALFVREVAGHQSGIRAVLAERPEIDPDGVFAAWGAPKPGKVARGATPRATRTVPGTKKGVVGGISAGRSASTARHDVAVVSRRRERHGAAFVNTGGGHRKWR